MDGKVSPPAGTGLLLLNQFADSLELSSETDNFVRSSIPAWCAYEIVREFTQRDNVWDSPSLGTAIESEAHRLLGGTNPVTGINLAEALASGAIRLTDLQGLAESSSTVQAMELADQFCLTFDVGVAGEKELKFGIPSDSMIQLVFDLHFDPGFKECARKDIYIATRARRIRHELRIDSMNDPLFNYVQVDRSKLTVSTSSTPEALSIPARTPSLLPSFPLYVKSVLKHSGPELAIALSLCSITALVSQWLRKFPSCDDTRYWKTYPLDVVLRGISAHPNSISQAGRFVQEALKGRQAFKYSSIDATKEQIMSVTEKHSLTDEVRDTLLGGISATYAHMVVFKQIDKRDSRALSKAGKWITIGRLKMFQSNINLGPIGTKSDFSRNHSGTGASAMYDV
jgi:hypothetical protein